MFLSQQISVVTHTQFEHECGPCSWKARTLQFLILTMIM